MKLCIKCQSPIPVRVCIKGKHHNLQRRKFCLNCSPFGAHNTRNLNFAPQTINGKRKRPNIVAMVRAFRARKKSKMIAYKGGKCQICGYKKCQQSLQFHHTNPATKSFEISLKSSWGFERMKPELDKCILLCSNCHGEVHAGITTIPTI